MFFRKRSKKEIEESLFFNYEPIFAKKTKKIYKKEVDTRIKKAKRFFNYELNDNFFKNYSALNNNQSKQVLVKNLNNLDKNGCKNALSYIIRNSKDDFVLDDNLEEKSLNEIMSDWEKDFSNKKKSKEVWHLCFSVKEIADENIENILKETVNYTMQKNFYGYKWALVLHSHQNNPHIHIILNKNNKFNNKKLHLSKKEFKDLFTNLRNDFAFALNLKGLNYCNKSRLEKNLDMQIRDLKNIYDYGTKKNLNLELAKMYENNQIKINNLESKTQKLSDDLQELYRFKNDFLLIELERLKAIDEKHKKAYKILKELKKINLEIKNTQNTITSLRNKIIKLKQHSFKIEKNRNLFKNLDDFNLNHKKNILSFLTKNQKELSLSQTIILKELEQEIKIKNEHLNENIKENIKASLIVASVLNKQNNSYELIKSHKELKYNLENLKSSDFSKIVLEKDLKTIYDNLINRMQSNIKTIESFMQDKMYILDKDFQNDKLSYFKIKEYQKLTNFLKIDEEEKIKTLLQRLELKYKEKDTIKETKTETENISTAGEKTIKQEQTKEVLQDKQTKSNTKDLKDKAFKYIKENDLKNINSGFKYFRDDF